MKLFSARFIVSKGEGKGKGKGKGWIRALRVEEKNRIVLLHICVCIKFVV